MGNGIKQMAEEDRPREKLMEKGEEALSKAELLAILIGSGTTEKSAVELMQEVMTVCDNRFSRLSQMSVEELTKFKGIGKAKAITIKAAAEIARRRSQEFVDDIQKVDNAGVVYDIMCPIMRDLDHEEFWALLINNNARLIKKTRLSIGGITSTAVDIRLLLKEALMVNATQIIVCHNHPSGSLRPSSDDVLLTEKIKTATNAVCIRLMDHVIITDGKYYSFLNEGKL